MRQQQPRNWLLELAVKALKYFLLSLAGCAIADVASVALEISFVSAVAIVILEQIFSKGIDSGHLLDGPCCDGRWLSHPRGPSLSHCGIELFTGIDSKN